MEGPVAVVETLLDEGEEHPVLLLLAVEEGTDMPGAVEDRTRQPYLLCLAHRASPFWSPAGNTTRSTTERKQDEIRRLVSRPPAPCSGRGRGAGRSPRSRMVRRSVRVSSETFPT